MFGKQLSPTCWSWGECPHFVVRIHGSVGEVRLSSCDKLKDFNMFCSLLSTCQMSYKSIPCQWSVRVPRLIFKQLSALLSPGYSDSKLCLSACWVSSRKEGLWSSALKAFQFLCPSAQEFSIWYWSNNFPFQYFSFIYSPEVRVVWFFSTHQPCKVLLFLTVWGGTSLLTLTALILQDCTVEPASNLRSNK